MRSSSLLFRPLALLSIALALGPLTACRKADTGDALARPQRIRLDPAHPEKWRDITFQDAHGRSWSHLLLNETTSPDYVGFRARYILTEPEFAVIEADYAWRHTRLADWLPFATFSEIAMKANLLREVRPVGASGWVAGLLAKSAEDIPPEELFKHCDPLNQYPGSSEAPAMPSQISGGLILRDVPDGDLPQGRRRNQMPNLSQQRVDVDIDAPDFENKIRALAEKVRLAQEEAKLPYPIQRLPAKDRPEIQTRLAAALRQMAAVPALKTRWQGSLAVFGIQPISATIEASYQKPFEETSASWGGNLSLTITRADQKEPSLRFEGHLDDRPGPTMASHFWLNTANLVDQSREEIAAGLAASSAPLTGTKALANCYVRFPDSQHMEVYARGVDLSVFTRLPEDSAAPAPVRPKAAGTGTGIRLTPKPPAPSGNR